MEYINFKHWVNFQQKNHYKEKVHATNTEKKQVAKNSICY